MPLRTSGTRWTALLLGLLAGLSAPVEAQQIPDTIPEPLDALVVSVTRTERRVRDLPATVTVLQRRDLRLSGATSVADFLRQIPGVAGQRQFSPLVAPPATGALALRGLGGTASSRTLVLLDGMPILDPFSGWMHWGRIPMEHVERVEIVRGGGAGIWGNRALGGVVNIITRDPTSSGGQAVVKGGGLGTVNGTVTGSYAGDGVGVLGLAELAATDGYVVTRPDQRGPVDDPSATRHGSYYAKVRWNLAGRTTLHLDGSYYDWERSGETAFQTNGTEGGLVRARLATQTEAGHAWTVSAHVIDQTYSAFNTSVSGDRTSERPTSDQFDVPSTAVGGTVQWARPTLAGHDITAGLDLEWARGENNERFAWSSSEDDFTRLRRSGGEAIQGGLYVQDSYRASRTLQLFAGARLSLWSVSEGLRLETLRATGEVTREERPSDRTVWTTDANLGFRYQASDRLAWRGMAFTGFRAPTLNELHRPFRSSGNVVGAANPALDPERLVGGEVGADLRLSRSASVRATVFWNHVFDAIGDATIEVTGSEAKTIPPCGRVPAQGVCRQRQNFGSFRSVGLEVDAELRPAPAWAVTASYIYNPTEVLEAEGRPELVGTRIRRVPEQQAKVRVSHVNPSFVNLALTGRYLGDMFDDDRNTSRIDDSFLVDLSVSRTVTTRLDAFLEVENLFDVENEVSRSTSGGVRIGLPRLVQGGVRIRL